LDPPQAEVLLRCCRNGGVDGAIGRDGKAEHVAASNVETRDRGLGPVRCDEMERFPGRGWPLVRTALEGLLVIERQFGLRGLSWFLEDGWRWPTDADDVLDPMARSDPDQRTRGWATDLLELNQSPGRVTTP
jgi:hypothetical protein